MTGYPANVQYIVLSYRIRVAAVTAVSVVEDESAVTVVSVVEYESSTYKFDASEIKAEENDVLSPDS